MDSCFSGLCPEANKHLDDNHVEHPTISLSERSLSETNMHLFGPGQGLSLPNFMPNENSMPHILAKQISNMSKNDESKIYEERLKIQQQQQQQGLQDENGDYIIDLEKAIRESSINESKPKKTVVSVANPVNKIKKPKTKACVKLSCKTDMSHILHQKIKKRKCSSFGKVLVSRLNRIAAPYFHEEILTAVKRFDSKTKKPCDLIKEQMRQSSRYNAYDYDIMKIVMSGYRESDVE